MVRYAPRARRHATIAWPLPDGCVAGGDSPAAWRLHPAGPVFGGPRWSNGFEHDRAPNARVYTPRLFASGVPEKAGRWAARTYAERVIRSVTGHVKGCLDPVSRSRGESP